MEQNKKEELRTLSECLCVKSEEGQTSDGQSVERYKHLAEQIEHSPALNDAILEQSILLMKQGRYCEAIQLFENRLSQNPRDLDAMGRWITVHYGWFRDAVSRLCPEVVYNLNYPSEYAWNALTSRKTLSTPGTRPESHCFLTGTQGRRPSSYTAF